MDKLTAKDLQRRYRAGERNFTEVDLSDESLRGLNLKSIDLSGADLSRTDIRGTNFSEAKLVGTLFVAAKAGTQRRWLLPQLVIAFALAALASFVVGVFWSALAISAVSPSGDFLSTVTGDRTFGVLGIMFSLGALRLIHVRGIPAVLGVALGALAITITFLVAFTGVFAFAGVVSAAVLTAVLAAVIMAVTGAGAGAVIMAVTGAGAGAVIMAVAGVVTGAVAGVVAVAANENESIVITIAIIGALAASIVNFLIARRTIQGDSRYTLTCNLAVWVSSWGSTKFIASNLTDASFQEATLKGAHFYKASLIRTNVHLAKKVILSRLGKTILANFEVQNLLIFLRGNGKAYIGLNLKGAYLAEADMADADFTEADLSQATLEGANIERANLTKAQALGTNFHQTILTGATLESWNIDSTTNLEGAICEYVFLLRNQQERRPSSGSFAPGEFAKLFQEVLDTIDLIFQHGVDWKAFIQTLNTVQVEHDRANLQIQAIENKGDGVVVVKLQAAPAADKAAIHQSFMQRYQKALKAVEQKYKAQLNAKDKEIQLHRQQSANMQNIAELLAQRPMTVEAKAIAGNNDVTDNSKNLNITGNVTGSTINFGAINGQVSNQINQLPPAAPGQPDIKKLLSQIQDSIQRESQLSEASRAVALEQLQALARAAQKPQDSAMKKVAKQSMTLLNNIAAVSGSVQMGLFIKQAWPLIRGLFGL